MGVVQCKSESETKGWGRANKVCRHTIFATLSAECFDIYWESSVTKYTIEDVSKQKFVIPN